MGNISSLSPESVWKYFGQITQIPRPSKHEQKIRQYLIDTAKFLNLKYKVDDSGNVVIYKPAVNSKSKDAIVLQSHMDMVCEKNSNVQFDFMSDPIDAYVDREWVRAHGTTLGADCGIGMALILVLLESENITHPELECLFTTDEETGLTGAFGLSTDLLKGKYLINLDSEDDGEIFIGCAGGIDTIAEFPYTSKTLESGSQCYKIEISSLKGGHSGDDINKGRANANRLLARILFVAFSKYDAHLCSIDGGNLRNAIPREANAVIAVKPSHETELFVLIDKFSKDFAQEYSVGDPDIKVNISKVSSPKTYIDDKTAQNLIYALSGVHNGVIEMSRKIENLVETSTNLASVKMKDNKIVVTTSQRSSLESAKYGAAYSVESVFKLAGAEVKHSDGYPGWQPNPNSKLLGVATDCYKKLFNEEPKVKAIHAGLECGLFLEKYPSLDMISFGPTILGAHSPDERIKIDTVNKAWKLLIDIIKKLS